MKRRSSIFWTAAALGVSLAMPARAEVPSALEPAYAEAVLAYNGKEYPKAVSMLDGLIAKDAKISEFYELKALSLKMMKDPVKASEVYQALIKAKTADSRPEREIAPYHFELGQIVFEKGDYASAKEHFTYAMRSGFNPSPSHFFLGMTNYRTKSWAESEAAFREVVRGDVEDLKPSAHFYIGQIALQTGNAGGATQSLFAARNAAKEQIDGKETGVETRKMAQTVYEQADASLKPFNRAKLFGNVTLVTGYDSNVLSVPSAQSASGTGTGQGSVKETLQAGLGYMTSPMNTYQWVPSYRASYNYNFNRDVRNGEFLTHDVSLYVTRNPLSASHWGLKLGGNFTFQNQVSPDTDSGSLKPYSLQASVGPYIRRELARKVLLGIEVYATPGKNYLDDEVPETYARSGFGLTSRVSLRNDTGATWWNPGVSVGYDLNGTKGEEYNSKGLIFGVTNAMNLSDATRFGFTADFSPISYSKRLGESRSDKMLALDLNVNQKLGERTSLVGDVQFINNTSNLVDIYQYKRLVVSAGLGYSL
jgi:tetratricopeptide (TPR) repeat protein